MTLARRHGPILQALYEVRDMMLTESGTEWAVAWNDLAHALDPIIRQAEKWREMTPAERRRAESIFRGPRSYR